MACEGLSLASEQLYQELEENDGLPDIVSGARIAVTGGSLIL
jgi:hypothetical protein